MFNLKQLFVTSLCWIASGATYACVHLDLGTPKENRSTICRDGYALGYSNFTKSADWVAYRLSSVGADGAAGKGAASFSLNDHKADPEIAKRFRVSPEDYSSAPYTLGHFANVSGVSRSEESKEQALYMSNVFAHPTSRSKELWQELELKEQEWANKRGLVYVYAGPHYEGDVTFFGNNYVAVPTKLWKVIYDPATMESISFIINQGISDASSLEDHIYSVDHVEEMTGFDIMEEMPEVFLSAEAESLSGHWN